MSTLYQVILLTQAHVNSGAPDVNLSITQVACERGFSTLKLIENRPILQSTTSGRIHMATEEDIHMALDTEGIIDKMAEKT